MTNVDIFSVNLVPVDDVNRPLTSRISVSTRGETIWPVRDEPDHSLEIQLDDLFSYLVEFWKPLLLRQTYPLALSPIRPSQLGRDAAKRWEDMPQPQVDEEASEIAAFEEAHDLSKAFGGLFDLPSLWLVREGDRMICDTGRIIERLPFDAFRTALTEIGDAIAKHLMQIDADKWNHVVEAWRHRDAGSKINLVCWSASVAPVVAQTLIARGLIEPPKSFADAANDNDELLIAARMAGALPISQITEILSVARRFDHHSAGQLDALSAAAVKHLRGLIPMKPFGEGEELAKFARQWLRIGWSEYVDIFDIANKLGITVLTDAVEPPTFDGLAIAGKRYGPGAFINTEGRRIKRGAADLTRDAGARVNLAHELCHLLIDRDHSLGAIEVLRSRMPAMIESRARAFAGEFLLPAAAAADVWDSAESPISREKLEPLLEELADRYGVSFSVAAWKLQHGAHEKGQELSAALDVLAPYR
jgi:hypothetical protein